MSALLEPKTIPVAMSDGTVKNFNLGKFPAVLGREILIKYPVSNMPKLVEYDVSEATMLKLMNHVEVVTETGGIRLSTKDLVNNHLDVAALMKIEWAMLDYNFGFIMSGLNSDSFTRSAKTVTEGIFKTLISSLGPLLQAAKRP